MVERCRSRVIDGRMVTRVVVSMSWGGLVQRSWSGLVGCDRLDGDQIGRWFGDERERFRMAIRWGFRLVGIGLKMEPGGFGMVRWWFGMLVDCWFWMVGNGFWMIWAWFWMVSGAWLIVYWGVEVLLAFVLNCGVVTIVVGAVRHDLGRWR